MARPVVRALEPLPSEHTPSEHTPSTATPLPPGLAASRPYLTTPSYRNYVIRSHRGDATQALLRIAAQQEKYYIQNNSYAAALDAGGLEMDTKSENGWYDLSITAGDVNGFTAEAVADSAGAQADHEACQKFSIDSEGRKLAFDSGGAANEDVCWR